MRTVLVISCLVLLLLTSCGDLLETGLEAANLMRDSEDSLILHYRFDGNTSDASGNGYDGIVTGDPNVYGRTVDRFGNSASCLGVGTGEYLDTTWGEGFNPINSFTINFWVWYPNSVATPDKEYLFGMSKEFIVGNETMFYLSKQDSGDVEFVMGLSLTTDKDRLTFTNLWSEFQDTVWHMITIVHQAGAGADKLSFYVDGVKRTPDSTLSNFEALQLPASIFICDARDQSLDAGVSNTIYSAFDDFRIYGRSINQKEIDALYHENGYNP